VVGLQRRLFVNAGLRIDSIVEMRRWRKSFMMTESRPALLSNLRETIAEIHRSFALLFSRLFSWHPSNPSGSHKMGQANGTVSNRDFLSEIGFALAARILDWTGSTCLSA
jgi:hypothetical protein